MTRSHPKNESWVAGTDASYRPRSEGRSLYVLHLTAPYFNWPQLLYLLRYQLDSNIKLTCTVCTFFVYQYLKSAQIDLRPLLWERVTIVQKKEVRAPEGRGSKAGDRNPTTDYLDRVERGLDSEDINFQSGANLISLMEILFFQIWPLQGQQTRGLEVSSKFLVCGPPVSFVWMEDVVVWLGIWGFPSCHSNCQPPPLLCTPVPPPHPASLTHRNKTERREGYSADKCSFSIT